jgi:hypothetical protein
MVSVVLAAVGAEACHSQPRRIDPVRAGQLKAAFLYRVSMFSNWPEPALNRNPRQFLLGVLGEDKHNVGKAMEAGTRQGLRVQSLPIVVERIDYAAPGTTGRAAFEKQIGRCHTLFVCPSEEQNWPDIRELTGHYPVLTFSEIKGFAQSGGMIEFVLVRRPDGTLNYNLHVDLAAVVDAGIRIPAPVLDLRYVEVVKKPEKGGAQGRLGTPAIGLVTWD